MVVSTLITQSLWFPQFNYLMLNQLKSPSLEVPASFKLTPRQHYVLLRRIESLPWGIVRCYPTLNEANQRLVALLGVALTDELVKTYLIVSLGNARKKDQLVISRQQAQAIVKAAMPATTSWSVLTLKRLRQALQTLLREAWLTVRQGSRDQILLPQVGPKLRDKLGSLHELRWFTNLIS